MPFIEPQDKTELVELKLKIRPEVKELIEEYARVLDNSDVSYVVGKVMQKVITADLKKVSGGGVARAKRTTKKAAVAA